MRDRNAAVKRLKCPYRKAVPATIRIADNNITLVILAAENTKVIVLPPDDSGPILIDQFIDLLVCAVCPYLYIKAMRDAGPLNVPRCASAQPHVALPIEFLQAGRYAIVLQEHLEARRPAIEMYLGCDRFYVEHSHPPYLFGSAFLVTSGRGLSIVY